MHAWSCLLFCQRILEPAQRHSKLRCFSSQFNTILLFQSTTPTFQFFWTNANKSEVAWWSLDPIPLLLLGLNLQRNTCSLDGISTSRSITFGISFEYITGLRVHAQVSSAVDAHMSTTLINSRVLVLYNFCQIILSSQIFQETAKPNSALQKIDRNSVTKFHQLPLPNWTFSTVKQPKA